MCLRLSVNKGKTRDLLPKKMMRRPVDQAKLLFLYFLRSSAAFASEPSKHAASSVLKASQQSQQQQSLVEAMGGYISLRVARRADVPSIQRCNLATLPENYNSNFYANHMRQWPELALVAEHVPAGCDTLHSSSSSSRQARSGRSLLGTLSGGSARISSNPSSSSLLGGYDGTGTTSTTANTCQIIGYVLGKVEEIPVRRTPLSTNNNNNNGNGGLRSPSKVQDDDSGFPVYNNDRRPPRLTERLGHVTSLAILDDYRRKGLAGQLMDQLHHEMKHRYNADAVGLHVRVSNEAATQLYATSMGYTVADVIPSYYQDGEDAYLMRKQVGDGRDDTSLLEDELEELQDSMGGASSKSSKFVRGFRFPKLGSSRSRRVDSGLLLPRTILEFNPNTMFEEEAKEIAPIPTAVSATASLQ